MSPRSRRLVLLCVGSALAWAATLSGASTPDRPQLAEPRPVTDTYWGVSVVDPYQYMENTEDPEVRAWVEAQDRRTRSRLDAFSQREVLEMRVAELLRGQSADYWRFEMAGDRLFAMTEQPPQQQDFLVQVASLDDRDGERAVVDPNRIDPSGGTSIDFYVPSPDGRVVAVSLSENGTEDGTLYFFDAESASPLPDRIPRVNGGTAGGSVVWTADSHGVYYTRYPYPGERPDEELFFHQQVWFHEMGSDLDEDRYVIGETFPRIAEIELDASDDHRWILISVSDGDGGEYAYWVGDGSGEWTRFADFEDGVEHAEFGADGRLYLRSRAGAPLKQILRLDPAAPDLSRAEIVVPESEAVITSFAATGDAIHVVEMVGGPTRLHTYALDGTSLGIRGGDELATISGLTRLPDGRVLYRRQTYLEPAAWFVVAPDDDEPRPTAYEKTSPADYAGFVVSREFATADDGTRIPIDIIHAEGLQRDGSTPTILHGYGSYGISQTPGFSASRLAWLEQGGIKAYACIRGGGEYGDGWHRAANLENKKVSMDDFAACARYLVEAGYTSPDRLAIEGGSAGGLLVYGTMVHYPDRMAAVIANVGYGDALRTELSPNGVFNVTEFGTVKDEVQFEGMMGYSPYHHVEKGRRYPDLLATTGMNDPRVEPWQSFKMVARMAAADPDALVLLRVSMDTGHGGGTALSEREALTVDEYCFLFDRLGAEYHPELVAPRAD